jgi:hypothetical protein
MVGARLTNAAAFDEVCHLLQVGHRKHSHTPEETLNRLFREHLMAHQRDIADSPTWLSSTNVVVTIERWATSALSEIAPKRDQSRRPRCQDVPVVIVRYRGRACLIDGGSRIHAWSEAGDTGERPAYVVAVPEGSADLEGPSFTLGR